jgi:hypothetical protein
MGWTTFYSFNGDEINENYPECSIAYFRFYWDQLEPREGEYRWDVIDDLIKTGRQRGQRLALRVMSMDGMEWAASYREQKKSGQLTPKNYRVPEWFRMLGCRGKEFRDEQWEADTPPMWEPDYGDPLYLEKHGNFVAALGQRYDGHTGIDHIDMGSFGRWGEWHCAAVSTPAFEARKRLIDTYLASFRKTPLLMPVADQEALSYSISQGTGWRADCLGDCRHGFFNELWEGGTPDWNHMEDVYLQRIVAAKGLKAWKRSPVIFEAGWSVEYWHEKGWPVQFVFDYGLSLHCSVFNNKSRPVPAEVRPQVNDFLRKMGYRFALKYIEHPKIIRQSAAMPLKMIWENQGVAPCYRRYPLAFRLQPMEGERNRVVLTNQDSRTWLPGWREIETALPIPTDLPGGTYVLSAGLIDIETMKPAIKLAIDGKDNEGWYPLSKIQLERH